MNKGRLEAFSDGVIAIIITIMVLELKVPHGSDIETLKPLLPVFLSYIMSFIYIGIYWNNHHHMLQVVKHISGPVLWANLHLLFWLSMVPFVTGWMGENHFTALPVALYGVVMMMAGVAYFILSLLLLKIHEKDSLLSVALGKDIKGKISIVAYMIAISFAFVNSSISMAIYVLVAIIWFLPDPRIEKVVQNNEKT